MILNTFIKHFFFYRGRANIFISFKILREYYIQKWYYILLQHNFIFNYFRFNSTHFIVCSYYFTSALTENYNSIRLRRYSHLYNVPCSPQLTFKNNKMSNSFSYNLNMSKRSENEQEINENNAPASFSKNTDDSNKNFKSFAPNGNPVFSNRQPNNNKSNSYNTGSANSGSGYYANPGMKCSGINNSGKYGNVNNIYYKSRDENVKRNVDTYRETNSYKMTSKHGDTIVSNSGHRINTRMNYLNPSANMNIREQKINRATSEIRTVDYTSDDHEVNEAAKMGNRDYVFSRGNMNQINSREMRTNNDDYDTINEIEEKNEVRDLGVHNNSGSNNYGNISADGGRVEGVGNVPDRFHYISENQQDSVKYNRGGSYNVNKKNTNTYVVNKNVNNKNTVRTVENTKRQYMDNIGGCNVKRDIPNNANYGSRDIRSGIPSNMNDMNKPGGFISGARNAVYQGNAIPCEQISKGHGVNDQINNVVLDKRQTSEENITFMNNRNRVTNQSVYDFVESTGNIYSGLKENEKPNYGANMGLRNIACEQKTSEELTEVAMNKINFHEDRRRDFVQSTSPPKKIILGINSGNRNIHTAVPRGEEERKNYNEPDKSIPSSSVPNSRNNNNSNIPPPPSSSLPSGTNSGTTPHINGSLSASLYLNCKEFENYMYKEENILTLYYIRKNYLKAESKDDYKTENDKIKYVITWVFSNDERVTATAYHANKKTSKKLCIEELLKKLKSISLLELEQMTKWMVNNLNVLFKIESKHVETKFNENTNLYHNVTEWKINNRLFKGQGISEYEKIAEMMGAQNLYITLYNLKSELMKEAEKVMVHDHYKPGMSGHGNMQGYIGRQPRTKLHEENNVALNNSMIKNFTDAQPYKMEGNNTGLGNNPYIDNRGATSGGGGVNEHYPGIHLKSASYEIAPPAKPLSPPPIISNAHMYGNTQNMYNVGNCANTSVPPRTSGICGSGSGSFTGLTVNSGSEMGASLNGSNNMPVSGGDSTSASSGYVSYNLTKHDCSFIQMLKHNIASKYKIIQTETVDVVPNGYKCILHWECKTGKAHFKISSVGFGSTKTLAKAEASYDMLIKNNLIEYVSPGDRKNAQYIKDLISVDLNKAVHLAIQFIHKYGSESWSIFLVNMFREIIAAGSYDAATRLLTAVIEASKKGREEIDEMNRLEEEAKKTQQSSNFNENTKINATIGSNVPIGIGGMESASTEQIYPHGKVASYEQIYAHGVGKGILGRSASCIEKEGSVGVGVGATAVGTGILGEPQHAVFFQNVYNSNVRKHINNQYIHRLVSVELWEKLIDECVVCLNSKLSFHCINLLQQMELDRSFFISTAAHNYYKKYRIMLALELQANINQSAQEKKDFEYLHDNKSLLLKIKTCTLPIISCTCLLTNEEKEWLKTTQMKEDDIVLLKPHDSDLKEDDVWANVLMGSITSAKYDNTVYNVNIRLFSADNSKKPDFKYTKYKMYLLLNIVTHERMLQVLKAITFIGAIPSQPASPYCFTPEIRFLLLHTHNKYSKHIAQKGRVNEEIADYENMKMDFFNNESIKHNTDDLVAEYRNESKNAYEDLLNEALNKQIEKDSIEEIDKFLIESVNLPTNLPLNDSQKLACISAMTRRLTLVQGPPGTGKTHVACAIVDSWHRQNSKKKILAVADSNVAANNLVEGLKKRNIQAVRVGAATDVDFHEDAIKEFTRYKELLKLRKENKLKEAKVMKALLFQEAVKKYNVVIATCVGSGHEIFDDERFERVIIDECAQSIEPSNLIPLGHYCNNLVLIGDHKQLPPTIISTDAAKMGLEVSLLERFINAKIAPVHLLSTQRRMHLSICVFPNMHFYDNKLKTANVTEENRPIIKGFVWPNPKCRVAFIDVSIGKAGSKFENSYGTSKFNLYEIEPLISVLKSVINEGCVSIDEIGILTAYDAQKIKLKAAVQKAFSHEAACRVEIDSIDGFQGKEKDLILFSAVRSNASNELGFLRDARRMNVMLTRAKRGVILFGDQFTLANDPTNWLPWLTWVASKRAIIHLTKLNEHLDSIDYSLFDKLNKINKAVNFNNIHVSDNYYYYGNDTGFSNDYNNMDMTSQVTTDLKASQMNVPVRDAVSENVEEEIVENWEDLL